MKTSSYGRSLAAITAGTMGLVCALLGLGAAQAQVVINDIRIFDTNASTQYLKNNQPTTQLVFEQVGTGKTALFTVFGPEIETLTAGTLTSINLLTEVIGPITSTDPLTVLRQPVVVTGDTVLAGFTIEQLRAFEAGEVLEISGFTNPRNSRRATRIDLAGPGAAQWQLTGYVRDVTPAGFSIGFQPVSLGGVVASECPNGALREGQLVEVLAAPKADILTDVVLDTVLSVTCIDRDPGSELKLIPTALEGFLRDSPEHDNLRVGGTAIEIGDATRFVNGDRSNFTAGVKIEALGLLDTQTRTLAATEIVFPEVRVVLSAPVNPEDILDDGRLLIMGFEVRITDQTKDDDGIGDIGLFARAQIRVIGFLDSADIIYADRIRITGAPDLLRSTLRGPVASVSEPILDILGVTVDSSSSTFVDSEGSPLAAAEFFEQVGTGSQIQVEAATFEEATRTLTGGVIQLQQLRDRSNRRGSMEFNEGAGLGTVTVAADLILAGSFENPDAPDR